MSSKETNLQIIEVTGDPRRVTWSSTKGRKYRLVAGETIKRRDGKVFATIKAFSDDGRTCYFRRGRACRTAHLEYEYDLSEHMLDGVALEPDPAGKALERMKSEWTAKGRPWPPPARPELEEVIAEADRKLATLEPRGLLVPGDGESLLHLVDQNERDGLGFMPAQPIEDLSDADTLRPPAEESVVGPIVEHIETVAGWLVNFVANEPLIEDEELGRKLGYERPRAVRDLIAKLFNDSELRRVSRQSSGRSASVVLLTERQALKVCLRSGTPTADRIQEEVMDVFLAVRRGHPTPATAPSGLVPDWAADIMGKLTLKTVEVEHSANEAKQQATQAHLAAEKAVRDAAEAKAVAEQARTLAGSGLVLEGLRPGGARHTPDGAFSALRPDGFIAMSSVARRYALPRAGEGRLVVAKIAEALGVFEIEGATTSDAVVIGGRERGSHRLYGPKALEILDKPLRTAFGVMQGLGFTTTQGGALVACRTGTRSKTWVLEQMVDAAIAPAAKADDVQGELFGKAS